MDDLFENENYLTNPEELADFVFDDSDSSVLSKDRQEKLLLAIDSFLAGCDILHNVFVLDLADPTQMMLDFLNYGFTFYTELDEVFELQQSSYIGLAVSAATFAFQTTSSIQEINEDWMNRLGSLDFCGTDFSAVEKFRF